MVSAKKDDIDKIRGLGLGADDYMTKPFSPGELVARVKAHLAQYQRLVGAVTKKQENNVIEVRGIRIDKSARRVYIDGEEKIFTTNLTYRNPELLKREWYATVDMSKYLAIIIDTLNYDKTISDLIDPVKRINAILENRNK